VVNDPTEPAVIEKVDEAQRAYIFTPSCQLKLTKPDKVQAANRRLTLNKTIRPSGIQIRALKYPQRAISLLVEINNAVLHTPQFAPKRKDARVSSILQPGKHLALPSSYRPARLLDTFGNLFAMILLVQNPK
jgi:hypothetical protein